MTEDILLPFDLPAVSRKKVTADFGGGLISSDGGLVLLREAEWTHPGKVEAPYTVCIASAWNLTGLVKSSVECRRTGL